jgi:hypothetical protein
MDGGERLLGLLEPGESLVATALATDSILAVTDRRVIVAISSRTVLALPFADLRRVEFDLEKVRPATLVIVPDLLAREPYVLIIPADQLESAGRVLAFIGERLSKPETTTGT